MGCIYSDFDGICSLGVKMDGETPLPECNRPRGCTDDAICVSEDDPYPENSCDSYESDYTCHMCGQDLNVDDCTCNEE